MEYNYHWYNFFGLVMTTIFVTLLPQSDMMEPSFFQTMFHSGHLDLMHEPIHIFILAFAHVLIWLMVLTLIGGR